MFAPLLAPLFAVTPHPLATTNAVLNATALVLLIVGYRLIKARREAAHKWTMLAAFATSVVFLTSYLTYHLAPPPIGIGGSVSFPGTGVIKGVYLTILVTHIVLAASVPFLAIATIWAGLTDRRPLHRKLAKWTFPIWVYVSVTGVVIYVMLYHLFG
jgi:uncharacterized membrane protein YozB (DUF420 family)